jgi:hypothetical protein
MKKLLLLLLLSHTLSFAQVIHNVDLWENKDLIAYGSIPTLTMPTGTNHSPDTSRRIERNTRILRPTQDDYRNGSVLRLSNMTNKSRLTMNKTSNLFVRAFVRDRVVSGTVPSSFHSGGQYSTPMVQHGYIHRSPLPGNTIQILRNHPNEWVEEILKVQDYVYIWTTMRNNEGILQIRAFFVVP